jgi:hypothetical protein
MYAQNYPTSADLKMDEYGCKYYQMNGIYLKVGIIHHELDNYEHGKYYTLTIIIENKSCDSFVFEQNQVKGVIFSGKKEYPCVFINMPQYLNEVGCMSPSNKQDQYTYRIANMNDDLFSKRVDPGQGIEGSIKIRYHKGDKLTFDIPVNETIYHFEWNKNEIVY